MYFELENRNIFRQTQTNNKLQVCFLCHDIAFDLTFCDKCDQAYCSRCINTLETPKCAICDSPNFKRTGPTTPALDNVNPNSLNLNLKDSCIHNDKDCSTCNEPTSKSKIFKEDCSVVALQRVDNIKCPFCHIRYPSNERMVHREQCQIRRIKCTKLYIFDKTENQEVKIDINIEINKSICYLCKNGKKRYTCYNCKKPICLQCQKEGIVGKTLSSLFKYTKNTFQSNTSRITFILWKFREIKSFSFSRALLFMLFYLLIGWLIDVIHIVNFVVFWVIYVLFVLLYVILFLLIYAPLRILYSVVINCGRKKCAAC
jgi:hypothetical protein